MPFSLRIIAENLLPHAGAPEVEPEMLAALARGERGFEIPLLIADVAGTADAESRNIGMEYSRNRERFAFLAWCQSAFRNFRVVPPDSGIVHQLNVERLRSAGRARDRRAPAGRDRNRPRTHDNELHQHVEPGQHDHRRPAGAERRGARP
jgi:hypothetical protein